MGFIDWLQLALIVLKIVGYLDGTSWFGVLSPYITYVALAFVLATAEEMKRRKENAERG